MGELQKNNNTSTKTSIGVTAGFWMVVFSTVALSWKSILVKYAYQYDVSAETLVYMRTLISTPFMVLMLLVVDGRKSFVLPLRRVTEVWILCVVGLAAPMLFSFKSLSYIDAALSNLVVFTYPAMTVLMLWLFFREKVSLKVLVSLAMTFVGLALLVRIHAGGFLQANSEGIGYALLAALSFAFYSAMTQRMLKLVTPLQMMALGASPVVIVLGLIAGPF